MNAPPRGGTTRGLLSELRTGLTATDIGFDRVRQLLIVNNVAAVPPTRQATSPTGGWPGFNAIALDGAGTPTHFCKCRPAVDPDVEREVLVARAAESDPDLSRHVPKSRLSRTSRLSACISAYQQGQPYRGEIAREGASRWERSVEEVLEIVERIGPHVKGALGAATPPGPVALAVESSWALDHLAAISLSTRQRDVLAGIIGGAQPLRPFLQHGDLWPSNILRGRDGWVIIDLENFGVVRAPLYDVFHLLHTSFVQRRPGGESGTAGWLHALRDGSADSVAARAILTRAMHRHSLGSEEALASLAFYLVDMASRIHARGVRGSDWRAFLEQAQLLAALIENGLEARSLGLDG